MRALIAESEPAAAREKRRASVGRSSGETFEALLNALEPGIELRRIAPADGETVGAEETERYDAVFLTGSPLHVYDDKPEVRRQLDFMRAVFRSGTPAFGSCAGLQVAVAAAGGRVRPMGERREAGFARRITATAEGRGHPLLDGRPPAWDAVSIHTDEVDALPPGATWLAMNGVTAIQAAEIRCGSGIFWGVQYHPELPLDEAAAALRRDADSLVEAGLVRSTAEVSEHAALVDALARDHGRRDLAWRLGLDEQVIDRTCRATELRNFFQHLVRPKIRARGRG